MYVFYYANINTLIIYFFLIMTLYSADVLDVAQPVSTSAPKKEKKPATEKQLAALAKAQETRKRKREEKEQAEAETLRLALEEEKKKADLAEAAEEKKRVAKEKRAAKRKEKQVAVQEKTPSHSEESVSEAVDEAVKHLETPPKPATSTSNEPPAWFQQYVAGVKKEEAKISREKKPQKQIKKEAKQVAQTQWADGFTRDRVQNEVDLHMSRMYQMMFGNRRMK
jgi:hypothetical protein